MKYYKNIISEDSHPKKIHVIFSEQINQSINLIWEYNQANTEALSQWQSSYSNLIEAKTQYRIYHIDYLRSIGQLE